MMSGLPNANASGLLAQTMRQIINLPYRSCPTMTTATKTNSACSRYAYAVHVHSFCVLLMCILTIFVWLIPILPCTHFPRVNFHKSWTGSLRWSRRRRSAVKVADRSR